MSVLGRCPLRESRLYYRFQALGFEKRVLQEANYRRSGGGDSRDTFHASKGEAIAGLTAYNKGREVLLAFAEDLGTITVDSLLTDTSLKRTPTVGPCLSLLPLLDSL